MSDSVQPCRRQPTRLRRPWDSPGKNIGVGCHFLLQCMRVKSESEVAQLCPTLCNPIDCSPPGSPIHGILQARVLEWGAIAFSMGLNKCVMAYTPHRIIQCLHYPKNPLCSACSSSPAPILTSCRTTDFFFFVFHSLCSFALSRMSCNSTHTAQSLFRLASFN